MTTAPITSPPNSPPAKRVKTDDNSIIVTDTSTNTNTMAENSSAGVSVPRLEQCPPLLVKKLSDKARLPTRGSAFAAGYDMYSSQAATVPARGKALVDTDIAISLPAGTCTFLTFPLLTYPSYAVRDGDARPVTHDQPRETWDQRS